MKESRREVNVVAPVLHRAVALALGELGECAVRGSRCRASGWRRHRSAGRRGRARRGRANALLQTGGGFVLGESLRDSRVVAASHATPKSEAPAIAQTILGRARSALSSLPMRAWFFLSAIDLGVRAATP